MCLIFVAWRKHPRYRLVVAANRDEFYARATAPAGFWDEAPGVLAGRDLEAGGTWLGVSRGGRFAALTNYRGGDVAGAGAPSRGHLVSEYLRARHAPQAYLDSLAGRAGAYNGFNLLVADGDGLHWYSNRAAGPRALAPGIYGISNSLLDTPWPKLVRGKTAFAELVDDAHVDVEAMFDLLADRQPSDDADLPDTGIGLERERALSSLFISTPDYGTRSSTVLLIEDTGDATLHERTHEPGTTASQTLTYTYPVEPDREAV
ncbi:MAG: hypothetical protein GWN21_00565 [Gammaproteobacteria bacterium]|nr:NRDE family protein [Gammaproteobacteria bacterium]NIR21844.1 NRDE family protein [Gammaproteobacteria bacterium]NIS03548.1 NRDE family protein [Gammaproteobacteria bacterium]NIU40041.1 hypothetical protein [Gammaproteobacteria bacterium]NIV45438.1 hypothetical protein [Gammaproteobacteria bacterium]